MYNLIDTSYRNEGIVMFKNDEIEYFLERNKIIYAPSRLPQGVEGIACYINNSYYVMINMENIQNQIQVYERIINVLKNNFHYESNNYESVIEIVKKLEECILLHGNKDENK